MAACNLATATAGSHVGRKVSDAGMKGNEPTGSDEKTGICYKTSRVLKDSDVSNAF